LDFFPHETPKRTRKKPKNKRIVYNYA